MDIFNLPSVGTKFHLQIPRFFSEVKYIKIKFKKLMVFDLRN
jgi:hypothetical protein